MIQQKKTFTKFAQKESFPMENEIHGLREIYFENKWFQNRSLAMFPTEKKENWGHSDSLAFSLFYLPKNQSPYKNREKGVFDWKQGRKIPNRNEIFFIKMKQKEKAKKKNPLDYLILKYTYIHRQWKSRKSLPSKRYYYCCCCNGPSWLVLRAPPVLLYIMGNLWGSKPISGNSSHNALGSP